MALTLINDCRADFASANSIEYTIKAGTKWRNRANERSYRFILDILEIDVLKVIKKITAYEDRARKALLLGVQDEMLFSSEDDLKVVGRGQRKAY